MLAAIEWEWRPRVVTDASAYELGGVLLQVDQERRWAPESFTSRTLKKAERRKAPAERESLTIVQSLQRWRRYLHGESPLGDTDHFTFKWVISLKDPGENLAR